MQCAKTKQFTKEYFIVDTKEPSVATEYDSELFDWGSDWDDCDKELDIECCQEPPLLWKTGTKQQIF